MGFSGGNEMYNDVADVLESLQKDMQDYADVYLVDGGVIDQMALSPISAYIQENLPRLLRMCETLQRHLREVTQSRRSEDNNAIENELGRRTARSEVARGLVVRKLGDVMESTHEMRTLMKQLQTDYPNSLADHTTAQSTAAQQSSTTATNALRVKHFLRTILYDIEDAQRLLSTAYPECRVPPVSSVKNSTTQPDGEEVKSIESAVLQDTIPLDSSLSVGVTCRGSSPSPEYTSCRSNSSSAPRNSSNTVPYIRRSTSADIGGSQPRGIATVDDVNSMPPSAMKSSQASSSSELGDYGATMKYVDPQTEVRSRPPPPLRVRFLISDESRAELSSDTTPRHTSVSLVSNSVLSNSNDEQTRSPRSAVATQSRGTMSMHLSQFSQHSPSSTPSSEAKVPHTTIYPVRPTTIGSNNSDNFLSSEKPTAATAAPVTQGEKPLLSLRSTLGLPPRSPPCKRAPAMNGASTATVESNMDFLKAASASISSITPSSPLHTASLATTHHTQRLPGELWPTIIETRRADLQQLLPLEVVELFNYGAETAVLQPSDVSNITFDVVDNYLNMSFNLHYPPQLTESEVQLRLTLCTYPLITALYEDVFLDYQKKEFVTLHTDNSCSTATHSTSSTNHPGESTGTQATPQSKSSDGVETPDASQRLEASQKSHLLPAALSESADASKKPAIVLHHHQVHLDGMHWGTVLDHVPKVEVESCVIRDVGALLCVLPSEARAACRNVTFDVDDGLGIVFDWDNAELLPGATPLAAAETDDLLHDCLLPLTRQLYDRTCVSLGLPSDPRSLPLRPRSKEASLLILPDKEELDRVSEATEEAVGQATAPESTTTAPSATKMTKPPPSPSQFRKDKAPPPKTMPKTSIVAQQVSALSPAEMATFARCGSNTSVSSAEAEPRELIPLPTVSAFPSIAAEKPQREASPPAHPPSQRGSWKNAAAALYNSWKTVQRAKSDPRSRSNSSVDAEPTTLNHLSLVHAVAVEVLQQLNPPLQSLSPNDNIPPNITIYVPRSSPSSPMSQSNNGTIHRSLPRRSSEPSCSTDRSTGEPTPIPCPATEEPKVKTSRPRLAPASSRPPKLQPEAVPSSRVPQPSTTTTAAAATTGEEKKTQGKSKDAALQVMSPRSPPLKVTKNLPPSARNMKEELVTRHAPSPRSLAEEKEPAAAVTQPPAPHLLQPASQRRPQGPQVEFLGPSAAVDSLKPNSISGRGPTKHSQQIPEHYRAPHADRSSRPPPLTVHGPAVSPSPSGRSQLASPRREPTRKDAAPPPSSRGRLSEDGLCATVEEKRLGVRLSGLKVVKVKGIAMKAGIQVGDCLRTIDGHTLLSSSDFNRIVTSHTMQAAVHSVFITAVRFNGTPTTYRVKLGGKPSASNTPNSDATLLNSTSTSFSAPGQNGGILRMLIPMQLQDKTSHRTSNPAANPTRARSAGVSSHSRSVKDGKRTLSAQRERVAVALTLRPREEPPVQLRHPINSVTAIPSTTIARRSTRG